MTILGILCSIEESKHVLDESLQHHRIATRLISQAQETQFMGAGWGTVSC